MSVDPAIERAIIEAQLRQGKPVDPNSSVQAAIAVSEKKKSEGLLEGLWKDVSSIPGAVKTAGEVLLRGSGNPIAGAGEYAAAHAANPQQVQEDFQQQARAAAVIGSTLVGGPVAKMAEKVVGPFGKRLAGKAIKGAITAGAVGGTYTGIREGKPLQGAAAGAVFGAALPPVSTALVGVGRGLGRIAANAVAKDPILKAKIEHEIAGAYVAWHRTFTTGLERMRKFGLGKVADALDESRSQGAMKAGGWLSQYNNATAGLNDYDKVVVGGIVEGHLNHAIQPETGRYLGLEGLVDDAKIPKVLSAASEVRNILQTAGKEIQDAGVPLFDPQSGALHEFALREGYIPHRIVNWQQYIQPGPTREEAIRRVIAGNIRRTEYAEQLLGDAKLRREILREGVSEAAGEVAARRAILKNTAKAGIISRSEKAERLVAVRHGERSLAAATERKQFAAERRAVASMIRNAREIHNQSTIRTRAEAEAWLESKYKQISGIEPGAANMYTSNPHIRSAHFMARTLSLPGYERNIDSVVPQYLESAAKRIELAKRLGPKSMTEGPAGQAITESLTPREMTTRAAYPQAFSELDNLAEGPAKDAAKAALMNYLGAAQQGSGWGYRFILRPLATAQVLSKLGLGFIMQPSQAMNAIIRTQYRGAARNMWRTLTRDPESLDFALRSGAILRSAVRSSELALIGGGAGRGETFLERTGFSFMDSQSRVFGALQGSTFAETQANKLAALSKMANPSPSMQQDLAKISQKLRSIGISPDEVLEQGGQLSDEQMLKAGQSVAFDVNFWGDSLSLAEAFSSPMGRFLLQFKSFGYQQFKMMKDHVVKPAVEYVRSGGTKGDLTPLARWVVLSQTGGEVLNQLKSLARNKKRENVNIAERLAQNAAALGGLGVMTDAIQATQYGDQGALSFLAGPGVTTAAKGIASVGSAAIGKPKPLQRFLIREVMPVVGTPAIGMITPAIESALFPSRTRPPYIGKESVEESK